MLLSYIYARIFSRKIFYKFNRFINFSSLRCLGVRGNQSGEEEFLKSHLATLESGVILDVGANIGNYAKNIRELNNASVIYCFEPHPRTFGKLQSAVDGLGIVAFNVAIDSAPGILSLYDYQNHDGSEHASLFKEVIEEFHAGQAVEHSVKAITLNEFAKENQIKRVSLLKVDTEGNELAVLKGFDTYINNNLVDLIHFEFNGMNVISRTFFKDFWDFLPNYDFFRMAEYGLIPIEKYDPLFCEIFAYQNIVAKLKAELIKK
ncbi:FkbM family methyltransferase [Oxalobacter vibrioformis]|uniref:FkbM family methyltransferase n=1 Tax=Oxalobacter vibrioformis TaxID=933080 RepID=A0A9E9LWW4_9BURK|nr:FkbM family methyltransferase [Oxalobacter vibrioformis]WAW09100.1 FkbM family methyltransferase [Oxalobacter vibrioformis]